MSEKNDGRPTKDEVDTYWEAKMDEVIEDHPIPEEMLEQLRKAGWRSSRRRLTPPPTRSSLIHFILLSLFGMTIFLTVMLPVSPFSTIASVIS